MYSLFNFISILNIIPNFISNFIIDLIFQIDSEIRSNNWNRITSQFAFHQSKFLKRNMSKYKVLWVRECVLAQHWMVLIIIIHEYYM